MDTRLRGCDGCGQPHPVKRLVTGILYNGSTSAVFLCHRCWDDEMVWRRERNAVILDPFPIIPWSEMRYVTAETGDV